MLLPDAPDRIANEVSIGSSFARRNCNGCVTTARRETVCDERLRAAVSRGPDPSASLVLVAFLGQLDSRERDRDLGAAVPRLDGERRAVVARLRGIDERLEAGRDLVAVEHPLRRVVGHRATARIEAGAPQPDRARERERLAVARAQDAGLRWPTWDRDVEQFRRCGVEPVAQQEADRDTAGREATRVEHCRSAAHAGTQGVPGPTIAGPLCPALWLDLAARVGRPAQLHLALGELRGRLADLGPPRRGGALPGGLAAALDPQERSGLDVGDEGLDKPRIDGGP